MAMEWKQSWWLELLIALQAIRPLDFKANTIDIEFNLKKLIYVLYQFHGEMKIKGC